MALSAPYYTVGKQRAQWHKNKGEAAMARAGGLGLTAAVMHYSPGAKDTPEGQVMRAVGAVGAGANVALGSYHFARATKINKDLRSKRIKNKKNSNLSSNNNLDAAFHTARAQHGNVS